MTSPKENLKDQKGQTFIEFIFLLVLLMTISFGFLSGFNNRIGDRWKLFLKIIAAPNAKEVNVP